MPEKPRTVIPKTVAHDTTTRPPVEDSTRSGQPFCESCRVGMRFEDLERNFLCGTGHTLVSSTATARTPSKNLAWRNDDILPNGVDCPKDPFRSFSAVCDRNRCGESTLSRSENPRLRSYNWRRELRLGELRIPRFESLRFLEGLRWLHQESL